MADIRRAPQPKEVMKGFKSVKPEKSTRDRDEVRRRMTREHDSKTDQFSKKNV